MCGDRLSRRGGIGFSSTSRQLWNEEFLNEVGGTRRPDSNETVFQRQSGAIAIFGWVVKIGQATGRKTSNNIRVIRLPTSVIAFTDN